MTDPRTSDLEISIQPHDLNVLSSPRDPNPVYTHRFVKNLVLLFSSPPLVWSSSRSRRILHAVSGCDSIHTSELQLKLHLPLRMAQWV